MKNFKHFVTKEFFPALMSGLVLFMTALMAVLPMAVMTGCTPAQIATFDNAVNTLEEHLPQLAQMATGLTALIDPEYVPLIAPGAAAIASDASLAKALIDDLKVATDATKLQKVDAYWQDINTNLQAMVTAVGVKSAKTTAAVNLFAGFAGEIILFIQDLNAKAPATPTVSMIRLNMPHVFGAWKLSGVHAIAYTTGDSEADAIMLEVNDTAAAPVASKHAIHSSRQIAKTWNVLAKDHPAVKLKVPRARFLGIPVPFTGH